ncbi:MAG: DUF790 family protein [Myxococcota bacterium]
MLTGDLIRVRTRKSALLPSFLDPSDEGALEDASWLVELVRHGLVRAVTRGELDEAVAAEAQVRPDHKVLRGLAKTLLDRATFDVEAPIPPPELRETVFKAAAARGPLALAPDPLGRTTADDVLADLSAELGVSPAAIRSCLYADRKEEQRIVECELMEPAALIARYNTGLVQSILLKATGVEVVLESPSAPKVRQLLRYVKFHQLIHQAWREGSALHLKIDGPISVLSQSTRYGLKLATFFPAVLLQEQWSLTADVKWQARGTKTLSLETGCGLVSHYVDRGGYVTREAEWFKERFEALDCDWSMEEGAEPLDLGGRAVVMPDFTFRRDGRVGHLEIIGYWRKDYLARRVELLREHGPGNLVLAVSRKLVADGSELEGFEGEVVGFASVVPAAQVRDALERVAR